MIGSWSTSAPTRSGAYDDRSSSSSPMSRARNGSAVAGSARPCTDRNILRQGRPAGRLTPKARRAMHEHLPLAAKHSRRPRPLLRPNSIAVTLPNGIVAFRHGTTRTPCRAHSGIKGACEAGDRYRRCALMESAVRDGSSSLQRSSAADQLKFPDQEPGVVLHSIFPQLARRWRTADLPDRPRRCW